MKTLRWICAALFSLVMALRELNERIRFMSQALTDLNNNVSTLNTTVTQVVAKLGQPSGVPESDVAAAASSIASVNSNLQAALNAAVPAGPTS